MTYTDRLNALLTDSEMRTLRHLVAYNSGDQGRRDTVAGIVAALGKVNGKAVTLADVAVAAQLTRATGRDVPPAGVTRRDDLEITTRNVRALFTEGYRPSEQQIKLSAIARDEPLLAGARATTDALTEQPDATGWRRVAEAGACPICSGRDGDERPADVEMWRHTGCACTRLPITANDRSTTT